MPRPSKLWRRRGRKGWWGTVGGVQTPFGEDRKEAEKAFHRAKAEAEPARASGRHQVEVMVDRYLTAIRGKVRPNTYRSYGMGLQAWVDDYGDMDCAKMTAEHLESWLERPTWGDSTRHNRGGAVKAWAKWLVKRRILREDPFKDVALPAVVRRKAAPDGELEAILAAANPHFRDFLAILIETGCRPGEAASLEASRVFPGTSTAEVVGKTGARLIGLSARAMAILAPLMEKHPTGPLLRTTKGGMWTDNAYQRRMRDLRPAGSKTTAYHTRHAFWGRAAKAGVNDIAVAKQLGHADLTMLSKVYSHADHQIMAETAKRASPGGPDGA